MTTQPAATILIVERTKFGWSVRADEDQLGLFTTHQHAIEAAGRCQAKLKAKGRSSTISVIGTIPETSGFAARPSWRR